MKDFFVKVIYFHFCIFNALNYHNRVQGNTTVVGSIPTWENKTRNASKIQRKVEKEVS